MAEPKQKSAKNTQEDSGPKYSKGQVSTQAYPAQIMEIVGSQGTREGGRQVRVKVLAGPDSGKIMRRNVIGPIKIGDILILRETEIEASPTKGRKH